MDVDDDSLTDSARDVLRLAWAMAVVRARGASPTQVVVDSFDLLAGLLLAHRERGHLNMVLRRYGVPKGAVMRRGIRVPVSSVEVAAVLRRLPATGPVPLDADSAATVKKALSFRLEEGLVPLRSLVGAFLERSAPAGEALLDELAVKGAPVDALVSAYHRFLHAGTDLSFDQVLDQLEARTPPRPHRVEIADYRPDRPGRHRRVPGPDDPPATTDCVGIGAEVDAFAYLIASKHLRPPLAVGLFGEWGSGKSFMLESIQRRIDDLVSRAEVVTRSQPEIPIYKHIVQIEFNAWQYVEGDIVASLVEHMFRNLRLGVDDPDDLVARRQAHWLGQLTEAGRNLAQVTARRRRLTEELTRASARVDRVHQERQAALATLELRRRTDPLAGWEPSPELQQQVQEAAQEAGLPLLDASGRQLAAALVDARETLRRSGPLLGALKTGGRRWTAALIAIVAAPPAAMWAIDATVGISSVQAAAAGVSSLLSGLAGYAAAGTALVRRKLGIVERARHALDRAMDEERAKLGDQVLAAERRLDELERDVDAAWADEREIAAREAAVRDELAAITPGRVLQEFVAERLGSDDYRKHLGIPALVRRDLDRLSRLVEAQNARLDSGRTELSDRDEFPLNRIVLYIDDLDRCPTDVVIQVLQAVHLLLAFPLFVVVVAVDARWLEGALREHFPALRNDGASPADYLEKIFQIPFWVGPLPPAARRQLAEGLLAPALLPAAGSADGADGDERTERSSTPPDFADLVADLFDASGQEPSLDTARVTVTSRELAAVRRLAPLLGNTPRAVKRFANLYLILKSIGRARGWLVPADAAIAEDTDRQAECLLWLLAISDTHPAVASQIFTAVERSSDPKRTLGDVVESLPSTPASQPVRVWVADNPSVGAAPAGSVAKWIPAVSRLSFRLGTLQDVWDQT